MTITLTPDSLDVALAGVFRQELTRRNLTKADLARAMGAPFDDVEDWISGDVAMPIAAFAVACATLDLRPSEVVRLAELRRDTEAGAR